MKKRSPISIINSVTAMTTAAFGIAGCMVGGGFGMWAVAASVPGFAAIATVGAAVLAEACMGLLGWSVLTNKNPFNR